MLAVRRADVTYAGEVMIWLTRIDDRPSGAALIARLRASAHSVVISKPAPTDPPNAWTRPADDAAAPEGSSVVEFDPRDWPSPADPAARPADIVLYALLLQAERLQREGPSVCGAAPSAAMREALAQYDRQRDPERD